MAVRLINPAPRHFNNSGKVLDSGVLSYFQPLTTTVKRSASVLSSSGLEPSVTVDGPCRVRLVDKNGVQLWSRDNVNEESTPPFSLWSGTETYLLNDLVSTADGGLYISRLPENFNNEPTSSPQAWRQVFFVYGSGMGTLPSILPLDGVMLTANGTSWQPIQVGEFAQNYLAGLELSNAADANHDITVSDGRCADSENQISMSLGEITKRIDATWAAGDNNGGLASGATLDPSETYHVFVVKVGSTVDVMFDSSITCQNGVENNAVTHYRRIGSVMTVAGPNIRPFVQFGDYFYHATQISELAGESPGDTDVIEQLVVPSGLKLKVMLSGRFVVSNTSPARYLIISDPDQPDQVPSMSAFQLMGMPPNAGAQQFSGPFMVTTDDSAQIRYRFTNGMAGTDFSLSTIGWIDPR